MADWRLGSRPVRRAARRLRQEGGPHRASPEAGNARQRTGTRRRAGARHRRSQGHRRGRLHLRPADRDELRGDVRVRRSTRTRASSRRRSTRSTTRRASSPTRTRPSSRPTATRPTRMLWLDLRAEPMVLSRAGGGQEALLLGAADRRQHLQLRLHRQPRHRQRGRRLPGRRPGLEGRDAAGHQEGVPLEHRVLARHLPHPALQPRRHAQRREGAGRLQGAAAVGVPEAAGAAGRAGDRLPEDRQGDWSRPTSSSTWTSRCSSRRPAPRKKRSAPSSPASASARARSSTSRTCRSSTRRPSCWR